jgi:magnesium chelatase subunit I
MERPTSPFSFKNTQDSPTRVARSRYPFSAIVGQLEMKRALILSAIDPGLGGVLLFGERGTGKSTAVRALREVLPNIRSVATCSYHCDPDQPDQWCSDCSELASIEVVDIPRPLVDLPLGTTEDRLLGAIHFERAVKEGIRVFEPGILANANRGILYVDEVNLLEDHIVDLLLDVAQSKENIVEREGLSVKHPAAFVLVGSCNPEEGELRPQLLDRFGLAVFLEKEDDVDARTEVVRRRLAFEDDSAAFVASYSEQEDLLRERIGNAMQNLNAIEIPNVAIERAAKISQALEMEGHRGDLTLVRAARALAAFEGRTAVLASDIDAVAITSLTHRLRRGPFDSYESGHRIAAVLESVR